MIFYVAFQAMSRFFPMFEIMRWWRERQHQRRWCLATSEAL